MATSETSDFVKRLQPLLAVMVPLVLVLMAYIKLQNASEDTAHDEKLRALMFSSLPTKAEVTAHWAADATAEAEFKAIMYDRLKRLEDHEREDAVNNAYLRGKLETLEAEARRK